MRQISSFTGVKNRYKTLRANIGSWLNFSELGEIVIVDWDSSDMGPKEHDYLSSLDPRIKLIRVGNRAQYHIAAALNMAAQRCAGQWLMRLDVDYVLNPYYNIFEAYQPSPHEFVTGDWTQKYLDKEYGFIEYLNGFLYVHRDAFFAVNGYDERMTDYGWEDDNLYLRLIDAGYARQTLDLSRRLIYHTPHGHDVRTANFQEKNKDVSWNANWERRGKPRPAAKPAAVAPPVPPVKKPEPPPQTQPQTQPQTPPQPAGRMPSKFVPKPKNI